MSKQSAVVLTAGVLAGGFVVYVCLFLAFERQALFEILNAVVVSVAVGVVIGFLSAAWRVLWSPISHQTAGDVLVLGIWLLWLGLTGAFLSLWCFRLTGDRWWLDAPWVAFTRWLIFGGGVLHLAAVGAIEGRIPARSYIRAGVVAGFGVAFALFLISFGVN